MAKGAVISKKFVEALGLSGSMYTLKKPLENRAHEILMEPMIHIEVEELPETVLVDRQYLYEHQFSIKPSYGAGEKILLWVRRETRHRNNDTNEKEAHLLLASDCFLMEDPREFLRFRMFLKSKKILDTQARDFLAKNAEKFPEMAETDDGLNRILNCLGNISEWPDPENSFRKKTGNDNSLEGLAKQYSEPLAKVRKHKSFIAGLFRCDPEQRVNAYRLICFVVDEEDANSLMVFIRDMGQKSGIESVIRATGGIKSGPELARGLEAVRRFLALPIG